ncbi:glutamine synthetase/guanido kinase [Mollisia scopiformis]|uniref:Glutamine synthetase/guanido kinase n=1 Tax=Mollisia scopiformis TaxID=149040 RepID=A0A132B4Q5_MOLSC|nr:glutamine synthetase/guanido kinase [Mollisia scopiformis]KUJ07311.1 glutamine synthetase/guanido kinase [Mollisia scopiformis]
MEDGFQQVKMIPNAYSAASLNNKYLPVVEEIVQCITKAGIKVRQFHSEGGPGVFEMSTEPLSPLQAADALVYCHETIKVVCRKHGLHGTVFPKPFEKLTGIGQHHHLSISPSEKEDSFLAGLLDHWKALAALYMPNYDSYFRLQPGQQVTWGTANRSTAIRKINTGHWELRAIDGTANPHLTMLAILTAGMLGLEAGQELKMKDCQEMIFLKHLDEKQAEGHGVTETMSTSLKESLNALRNDKALVDKLGPEIIDKYLKMKEKENENFSQLTLQERKDISMRIF